jgi:hypothetical protein
MRTCLIYSYDTGKQELVGKVFLNEESWISFEVSPGEELAMSRLINSPVRIRETGEIVKKEDDPVKWFENLAKWYHGSYFWAEMQGKPTP